MFLICPSTHLSLIKGELINTLYKINLKILRGIKMSCTIYYKGTLKEDNTQNDVAEIVLKHLKYMNATLEKTNNIIAIYFKKGLNEPLVFEFSKKNKINGFCKWNGEDLDEFYKIIDMFYELKPLFKLLKVDDDEGIWNEFIAQKNPCKIKLRELNEIELKLLERMKINEVIPINELEKFVMKELNLKPFYKSLLRIIVQDFIKIIKFVKLIDFKSQLINDYVNKLEYFGPNYIHYTDSSGFFYNFSIKLLEIWISDNFIYKKMGYVKELKNNIKGFDTSKIAALYGIHSIFLNCHAGGASNSKEAEMIKFAKKYYNVPYREIMVIDTPENELKMLFSMMDYLGFSYVGLE